MASEEEWKIAFAASCAGNGEERGELRDADVTHFTSPERAN
jgi:hypothetical protein